MLRNPAYKGTACFGKTERTERKKITRPLRQRGGFSPRSSASRERPREEWIEVPVPAIVSTEIFDLAQERLASNKRFSPRRTIEPTLLQGILVCQECGYAYYRTSTETSKRRLYYYRCLGSDAYRSFNQGHVCGNRPVRADYLDELVWNQIIEMLKNPELIRSEIDRRVREIQNSSPTKMRKEVLLKEAVRVQKGIDRLLDAYQEGLLPLEQLRARMPNLRKREATLKSELQTLEANVVDQDRVRELAGSIEGFLERLNRSAHTLEVKERQRILRLVVKEILIGPDKLTIKHSIPTSGSGPNGGAGTSEVPSYVLCGRSHDSTLRRPSLSRHQSPVLQLRRGLKPPLYVEQYPLAVRVPPDRAHDKIVVEIVEETFDVQIENPVEAPTSLTRCPDCLNRGFPRPIPVGIRMELFLHHSFQLHLDNCLGDPITDRRYP
jgi:site-specific DNA recombinase